MSRLEALNRQFSLSGLVFQEGPGGLIQAIVHTPTCSGAVFLHGAHVTEWTPSGCKPVLWMSRESQFTSGKPIRGGIPICFPWFGPHPTDSSQPAHGTARTSEWTLTKVEQTANDGIAFEFQVQLGDFSLSYRVDFGHTLNLMMTVARSSKSLTSDSCELALHTYLAVGDINSVRISGLEKVSYIDKMDGATVKAASGEAISFVGETDRVYFDTDDQCQLIDPVLQRRILVEKCGSKSTVVWNPWIAKSQRMADFGDEEWPGMVCIESANVGPNRMALGPGESTEVAVQIAVA